MSNFLSLLKSKSIKTRVFAPMDEFYDRRLGVRTFGFKKYEDNWDDPQWNGHYIPSTYKTVFALLKEAGVGANSHVVDFGSGLGRILFAAAFLGAETCVGCEFDEELVMLSRQNCARSRYGSRVRIEHCDATIFDIPVESNLIFFFNPFGSGIMSKVICNLEHSLLANPRRMEIVYFNPSFNDALKYSNVFSLRNRWSEVKGKRYAAEFWNNREQRD